jgi:cyclic beta-1,2-glucan synthetase
MLNPITHSTDPRSAELYGVEPYVVAADVYSVGDKRGRGGWTWYTGSSGWMYRSAVEAILGITRRGDRLHVSPALPGDWPGYEARLRLAGEQFQIQVRRTGASYDVTVNGLRLDAGDGFSIQASRQLT